MKFKAVFMDFYGTVAGGDAEAIEAVCAKVVRDLRLQTDAHRFAAAWGGAFFRSLDDCRMNGFRSLYACECDSLVATCEALSVRVAPEAYVDELMEYMSAPSLHDDAKATLERIGLPVCCVSNADVDHLHAAIDHHDLPFAEVVCSEGVRCYKPDAGIFKAALNLLSLRPDEVIHIGDSLHSDVAGARNAGITSVWLCRDRRVHDVGDAQADHKVASLNDLHDIVR